MERLTKRQSGEQKRLHDQLDFFGAKKKRFVSIYAKKPRIRLKVKDDSRVTYPPLGVGSLGLQQLAALGAARSSLAIQQAAAAQGIGELQALGAQNHNSAFAATGLMGALGSTAGLGRLQRGVYGIF